MQGTAGKKKRYTTKLGVSLQKIAPEFQAAFIQAKSDDGEPEFKDRDKDRGPKEIHHEINKKNCPKWEEHM